MVRNPDVYPDAVASDPKTVATSDPKTAVATDLAHHVRHAVSVMILMGLALVTM